MLADRLIFVITIIIAVAYLYGTTLIPSLEIGDPLGPKAFPRLLGVCLLLAAAMFGLELWRNRKQSAAADEPPPFDSSIVAMLAVVVVWTGVYYLAFEPAGFILATAFYLLPLCAYFNRGKWIANVLTCVLFAIGVYFLFGKLEVNLPKGVLPF
jgi:putative tricarboxylic transport membrane protein